MTIDAPTRESYGDDKAPLRRVGLGREGMSMGRCESCGMPLNETTHGAEAEGSPSAAYCRTCYAEGAFTAPEAGIDAVRISAIAALVEQGVPPLTATRLTATMESLPRWA